MKIENEKGVIRGLLYDKNTGRNSKEEQWYFFFFLLLLLLLLLL